MGSAAASVFSSSAFVSFSVSALDVSSAFKVDEELYFEGKFDTEAMLNVLEKKVLEPAGVDYSSIKIRYMAKGQEQANGIEPVPEQDVLEHEEQEQHVPVQTM